MIALPKVILLPYFAGAAVLALAPPAAAEQKYEILIDGLSILLHSPSEGLVDEEGYDLILGREGLVSLLLGTASGISPSFESNPSIEIFLNQGEDFSKVYASVLKINSSSGEEQLIDVDVESGIFPSEVCEAALSMKCSNVNLEEILFYQSNDNDLSDIDLDSWIESEVLATINIGSPGVLSRSTYFLIENDNQNDLSVPEGVSIAQPETLFRSSQAIGSNDYDGGFDREDREIKPLFVVHCTASSASDESAKKILQRYREKGVFWKGGAWILRSGERETLVNLGGKNELATKTESTKCPNTWRLARRPLINVEVHYNCRPDSVNLPTPEQYSAVAKYYKDAFDIFGPINVTSHRHVDRGIPDGHSDPHPESFSFATLEREINQLGVDTSGIQFISDKQNSYPNWRDHSHFFPPDWSFSMTLDSIRPDDC